MKIGKNVSAALLIAASAANPVFAADVGVALVIGQPGFYGRIEIGDYPPPRLIYRQPRFVERGLYGRPPIYLHVPPGHAKNWRKHCGAYNACGEQVYFVQDNWYRREYVPRYQQRHEQRREEGRGDSREERGGNRHDDHGHGRNR